MKNVVFFVHGIGRQKEGWARETDGPITALQEASEQYDCFGPGKSLTEQLDLIEVRYDDVFDQVLTQWKELAETLPTTPGAPWVQSVKDLLIEVGNDKNTYAACGGDVLLYCGFALVARAVRLHVIAKIVAEVFARWSKIIENSKAVNAVLKMEEFPKVAVVSHSLGTTIAHDALFQLSTANWIDDVDIVTEKLPTIDKPPLSGVEKSHFDTVVAARRDHPERPLPVPLEALFLISNTYPLLKQVNGDYLMVQNEKTGFHCATFFNVANKFDPVCRAKPFTMPARGGGVDIEVAHVHQRNPHGFAHYLSHPHVHGRIFRSMVPSFTGAHLKRCIALGNGPDWKNVGGDLKNELQTLKDELVDRLVAATVASDNVLDFRRIFELLAKI